MATQFLVRSPGNKHAISLKTVLYDGVGLSRIIDDNGTVVFELSDSDVQVELVVRRRNNSSYSEEEEETTAAKTEEASSIPSRNDLVEAGSIVSREVPLEAAKRSLVGAETILPRDLPLGDAKRPREPTDEAMVSRFWRTIFMTWL